MRILQVLRAPVGGLFRHVADLTRALDARGHQVGIAVDSLAGDAQTETLLAQLEPHARLGIHRLPMPRLFGKADLTTTLAVGRLVRRLDADIVHGHGAKGGFYARLAGYGRNHAAIFYTPHGGVLHFPDTALSGQLFHRIERQLMGKTAAIIFESQYAEKTYSALIGAPTCPSRIIHNGLRPDEFVPVPPDADAVEFVFIGELRRLKGIFTLIDALPFVRHPDGRPARLVMAGDGPDRAELENRIASLGLTDRVTLVGSQPARKMFARGRCAVVPSLAESLPYVVLEAAAARLPVITTRVGGIPEIFGPTADRLIAPEDSAVLADAMNAVLANPGAAEAEMEQRLAYIRGNFTLERMADAIEALYRQR